VLCRCALEIGGRRTPRRISRRLFQARDLVTKHHLVHHHLAKPPNRSLPHHSNTRLKYFYCAPEPPGLLHNSITHHIDLMGLVRGCFLPRAQMCTPSSCLEVWFIWYLVTCSASFSERYMNLQSVVVVTSNLQLFRRRNGRSSFLFHVKHMLRRHRSTSSQSLYIAPTHHVPDFVTKQCSPVTVY
jgi:hypothetical protein